MKYYTFLIASQVQMLTIGDKKSLNQEIKVTGTYQLYQSSRSRSASKFEGHIKIISNKSLNNEIHVKMT